MTERKHACEIFNAALKAANPDTGIRRVVSRDSVGIVIDGVRYPAETYKRVMVVGAGKASARMGSAVEDILGSSIDTGWINTKDGHSLPLERITVHECGHPVPDERGLAGSVSINKLLESADDGTLVIGLISGGGSALLPAPVPGITLAEKQEITKLLLKAGASINELNAVRKHLSTLKGGGLARAASPAAVHLLILSDVIGDPLDTIASGPGVADESTYADCLGIIDRYSLRNSVPASIIRRFKEGAAGNVPETAKPGDGFLAGVRTTLIGNNAISVEAAHNSAVSLGYNTMILTTVLEGEASEVGTVLASIALEVDRNDRPLKRPACLIAGGETTVTVTGEGLGGRNQEMAAVVAERCAGLERFAFLSGGTDGTDGPTDAAGGVVDGETRARGQRLGLNVRSFIADNDTYHYLKAVNGLLMTGPTGTNVMDIHLLLLGES